MGRRRNEGVGIREGTVAGKEVCGCGGEQGIARSPGCQDSPVGCGAEVMAYLKYEIHFKYLLTFTVHLISL